MPGVLDISMKERTITLMCFAKLPGIEPVAEMYVETRTTTLLGECMLRHERQLC
ncbi:hypothetical protein DPMN_113081 [Dreissena polymorpha]|uniref:Uncharacterized protein n=1 Tax=Dreissena polymorpha TaxID=45954 RepID=A0A9D4KHM7_DREPO|nr:hypothetical protein DPMN_113081 [Dreissena polymorpha]